MTFWERHPVTSLFAPTSGYSFGDQADFPKVDHFQAGSGGIGAFPACLTFLICTPNNDSKIHRGLCQRLIAGKVEKENWSETDPQCTKSLMTARVTPIEDFSAGQSRWVSQFWNVWRGADVSRLVRVLPGCRMSLKCMIFGTAERVLEVSPGSQDCGK